MPFFPFPMPRLLCCLALLLAGAVRVAGDEDASNYPNRPIKLIIPFSAGGSSDTFARIIAKALRDEDLLPQPLVIINVNGASGTIGSRRVKNARPDGYTLMMLHESIITTKHAGLSSYGSEAFAPVAATGEFAIVLAAATDSRLESLDDVLRSATEKPDELVFGTAIGAPTHMLGLLLEKAHGGARFRFSQAGSGAQRISALTGGHIALSPFSIEEFLRYEPAGIKAFAVFDRKRHAALPDLPTAIELGYPVLSTNRNFWWFPKGTPQDRIDTISHALQRVMETEYVREKLAFSAIEPTFLDGEALVQEIAERNATLATVTLVQTEAVPNFALWSLLIALGLLGAVLVRDARQRAGAPQPVATPRPAGPAPANAQAYFAFALTLLYVAAIATEQVGYAAATTVYCLVLCLVVGGFSLRSGIKALPFSLAMGYGLAYLFTELLTIDLPG